MRRLYQLLLRFHALLVFLLLQFVAIGLLIRTNTLQYSSYLSTENSLVSGLLERRDRIVDYFKYDEINLQLSEQLASEKNRSPESFVITEGHKFYTKQDTLFMQKWDYSNAKVINKDVYKPNNTLTLQGGEAQGFDTDMGVISGDRIVGIIKGVSENFSVVLPVINQKFKTTIKHKKTGDMGTLEEWDGLDPQYSFVHGLPATANLSEGDSIVTSGMSALFPENIFVGTIAEIRNNESADSYILKIKLAVDFFSLEYVQVVDNLMKIEQQQLEQNMSEDDS